MKTKNHLVKKIMLGLSALAIMFISSNGHAQNIFPPTGNAGIGTTSPTLPLQIKGTGSNSFEIDGSHPTWAGMYIKSTNTTGNAYYGYLSNNGSKEASSYLTPTGDWRLEVQGSDRIHVGSNGNIGIGTSTPAYILDVNGRARFRSGGGNNSAGAWYNNTANTSERAFIGMSGDDHIGFYGKSAWGLLMNVNNGYVGIGTNLSPIYPLHVTAPGATCFQIEGSDSQWAGMNIKSTNQTGNAYYGYENKNGNAATSFLSPEGDWRLEVGVVGKLEVLKNGFVGIGTTTPSYILDVNGRARFRSGGGNNSAGAWYMNTANANDRAFIGMAGDDNIGFFGSGFGWGLLMNVNNGKVLIGSASTPDGYKLFVETGILTEKVKCALKSGAQWADHVFASSYKLKPLTEVETFIKSNKHLEGIPSADDLVKDGGINMNEMFAKQMEKIEELTLYVIDMKKEIETLKTENAILKSDKH